MVENKLENVKSNLFKNITDFLNVKDFLILVNLSKKLRENILTSNEFYDYMSIIDYLRNNQFRIFDNFYYDFSALLSEIFSVEKSNKLRYCEEIVNKILMNKFAMIYLSFSTNSVSDTGQINSLTDYELLSEYEMTENGLGLFCYIPANKFLSHLFEKTLSLLEHEEDNS